MIDGKEMATVVLICNSAWYAWNFRENTIRALCSRGFKVTVLAPPDAAVAKILAIDAVEYIPWQLSIDGRNPFREAASIARLIGYLKRIRPVWVFSFTIKPNIYGGIACRILRIPYAPNVTGIGMVIASGSILGRVLSKLYAYACSRAVRLFVQNAYDLDVLRQAGISASVPVVFLKGSGVDLARFAAHAMPPVRPCAFIFVGRLQEDKGVRDFVAAARALRAEGVLSRFIVVGGTEQTNSSGLSQNDIETWRDEGIVEFVGIQDDVRPWLRQAHVLVLPSHGGEGIPRVILEAASVGRAAIVSDVPGCRDAVVDRETGLIIPAHNHAALVAAMKAMAEMPIESLEEMGRNARRLAEANFSEERVIMEYLECLK
jgi:glycosyltransferase involved in cell wall biosynthesis